MRFVLAFVLCASGAWAEVCPIGPDRTKDLDRIYVDLGRAPTATAANDLSGSLWAIWLDAPDAKAQALLDLGMQKRRGFDLRGARDVLGDLIAYCPTYAEGYNQRAYASFLRRDYDSALEDLEIVLSMDPRHIGALSGKALTLFGLGRNQEAKAVLSQAVRLNPWLPERELIGGTDI